MADKKMKIVKSSKGICPILLLLRFIDSLGSHYWFGDLIITNVPSNYKITITVVC